MPVDLAKARSRVCFQRANGSQAARRRPFAGGARRIFTRERVALGKTRATRRVARDLARVLGGC